MTDDIDEIVRRLRQARCNALRDHDAVLFEEAADALERLKTERDLFDTQATGLFHKCAQLMPRAEAAEKERDELKSIGDGIAEVLETNGYVYMVNPNGISSILEELNAERARAEAAEKMLHGLEAQLRVSGNHDR